jgi:hypothetical protein
MIQWNTQPGSLANRHPTDALSEFGQSSVGVLSNQHYFRRAPKQDSDSNVCSLLAA